MIFFVLCCEICGYQTRSDHLTRIATRRLLKFRILRRAAVAIDEVQRIVEGVRIRRAARVIDRVEARKLTKLRFIETRSEILHAERALFFMARERVIDPCALGR